MKMKRTFIVLAALISSTAAEAQIYPGSRGHALGSGAYGYYYNDPGTEALVIRRGQPPAYEPYRSSNPAEVPGFEEPFARSFMHW